MASATMSHPFDGEDCGAVFADGPLESSHVAVDDAASDCSTAIGSSVDAHDCVSIVSTCCPEVETLVIFDWDDTLFPTTWLERHLLLSDGVEWSSEQRAQLEKMAEYARSTLEAAVQIGKVVIVTNAERGWVEKSCTKFMPSLVSLLKTIDIVSARTDHEQSTRTPTEWKRLAFEQEVDRFYDSSYANQYRNIVSLGDSPHEVEALRRVADVAPKCFGKSIKLLEAPSIEELLQQHEFLLTCLLNVAEHDGNLDVEIGADDVA